MNALDCGVGAVLSQVGEDGPERPVAHFSRKLLPREVWYSTIEKECLAIKLRVKAYHAYLIRSPDGSQVSSVAGQTEGQKHEAGAMESGPPTVFFQGHPPSWIVQWQC